MMGFNKKSVLRDSILFKFPSEQVEKLIKALLAAMQKRGP